MPITEGPGIDDRTAFVRALIEWLKDEPSAQQQYQVAHDTAIADRAAHEERVQRMRAIARLKRGRKPGTRPWQAAGFGVRQDWLDAGSPEPVIAPTKRELIEKHLSHRRKKVVSR